MNRNSDTRGQEMRSKRTDGERYRLRCLAVLCLAFLLSIFHLPSYANDVYVAPESPDNNVFTTFAQPAAGDLLTLNIHKKLATTPDINGSDVAEQDASDDILWRSTSKSGSLHVYSLAGPAGQGAKKKEPFWVRVHGTFGTGGGTSGSAGSPEPGSAFDATAYQAEFIVFVDQPVSGSRKPYKIGVGPGHTWWTFSLKPASAVSHYCPSRAWDLIRAD